MKKILPLLLLACGLHGSSWAQDASNKGTKKSTQPKQGADSKSSQKKVSDLAAFSQDPFDANAETLPIDFRGHSCIAISDRLKAFKLKKDEFESTKAYAERVEHVKSEPIYGNLNGSSIIAMSPDKPLLMPNYNADTETMTVRMLSHGSRTTMIGEGFFSSALINSSLSSTQKYIGENGYGKKVEITSSVYDACGITFANIKSQGPSTGIPSDFSFKISPDDARLNKGAIRILYIAKLESPFLSRYGNMIKPTMDNPIELLWNGDSLVMKLSQVWLYSSVTGKVFSKELLQ
ncbi:MULTISPECIES: hypothetical protein [unclassified Janthinobacterium]|uniref:hypothetical protein n=1 Tax=unclassified Janthinobacterium TaxID=2610881 RepID=UPI00160895C8|nr:MULTISPECIES: hypothetical protein [unclassified Janthinobacterium]MBB5610393.1 hypothetical protein [Janthinobacterium sp. S3T4]MBB5615770.1 hypothetical protein [Janthinobacterium sp. S3M3]